MEVLIWVLLSIVLILIVLIIFLKRGSVSIKSRTVNFGLNDIGELATQAGYFTNVQVISSSKQLFGNDIPMTQNKYVFSYDGIIKTGIDFEAIEVNVDDTSHTIKVKLPEVKILSIEIDENSFEIYDERNNIFNPLVLKDINKSMIALKNETRDNAINKGIFKSTRSNSETLIKGFLAGSFDMKQYSIIFE